jgi:hypothetical protein
MPWNNVKPIIKAAPECVRIGVLKVRNGTAKSTITISDALCVDLGRPECCNIFEGDGDEKGSLLIQFDTDGEHKLSELGLGGGRILCPLLNGAGDAGSKPRPVAFEKAKSDDGTQQLIVTLPW